MTDRVYFNARSKALEAKLIPMQQMITLARSESLDDAVKTLSGLKLLQGISANCYYDLFEIVHREEKEFIHFLKTVTSNKLISKFFLLKYDYFNLENIYLSHKLNIDNVDLMPEGELSIESITKSIESKKYENFSPQMQNCLKYADELFDNDKQSGFMIDTAFKKALYAEKLEVSKVNVHLQKIMEFIVDVNNIQLALRFRDEKIFKEIKLDGGTLKDDFLNKLCFDDFNKILSDTKISSYRAMIDLIISELNKGVSLSKFEYMVDCFSVTYFDKYKYEMNGDIPYLRYCFLRQNEIINLRIIFQGLMDNRKKQTIIKDIRRVYAE